MSTSALGLSRNDFDKIMLAPVTPVVTNNGLYPMAQQMAPGFAAAMSQPNYSSDSLTTMISMRLRSRREDFFDHWHAHKIGDERVVLFIVHKGQEVVLSDPWPLFPSDTLITQLRLLEGK